MDQRSVVLIMVLHVYLSYWLNSFVRMVIGQIVLSLMS